ncbi:unnamed protein product [Toxocara canis]|uniref:TMhelix containing protein n=1 Tax=Toxocara canis TaxID=6265 RepID=A0A183TVP4_TOXCA|nr:unnamed protein product [Toxocara canis]
MAKLKTLDKTSAMLAKELEDIAVHWRWITVAATAVAIAVGASPWFSSAHSMHSACYDVASYGVEIRKEG